MTFEKAFKFIKAAERKKADIQIRQNVWKYTDNPENEWNEDDKAKFACDLCNWAERGSYIGMILPNGRRIPLK